MAMPVRSASGGWRTWRGCSLAAVGLLLCLATSAAAQAPIVRDVTVPDDVDVRVDDLTRLATAYADVLRERRIAQLSVQTLRTLPPHTLVTGLEAAIADANLKAAQQKSSAMQAILTSELSAVEAQLDILREFEVAAGELQLDGRTRRIARVKVQRGEAARRMLQMILEMD